MQWYRAYVGMSADPKFKVVASMAHTDRVVALSIWVAMLEHACSHEGSIHDLSPLDIGCALDIPADVVQRVMTAFAEKGMIEGSFIAAWKRRQFVSDSSVERVRNWRRKRGDGDVTLRNGDVTPPEQNRSEQSRSERVEGAPRAASPTKGTRFPHETMPEPWKQFCLQQRPDLDPSATFDRCRDYWISAPGQRGVKRDWDATWRNWVRNERKGNGHAESMPAGPPAGMRDASTAEYIRYMREKLGDPKFDHGHPMFSKWQHVPKDWKR